MRLTSIRRVPVLGSSRDRGDVSVEAVIGFPILLLAVFACVQMTFNAFGRAALQAAAQDALSAAQTNSTGIAVWRDPDAVARQSAGRNAGFVGGVRSDIVPLPDGRVRVTVRGRVPSAFPGATMVIVGSATGTLDAFRPQGEP
jgi:Flp pilus assembly protein TadG